MSTKKVKPIAKSTKNIEFDVINKEVKQMKARNQQKTSNGSLTPNSNNK